MYYCIDVNFTLPDMGSSQQIETTSSSHHNNHTANKQIHEAKPNEADTTEADELVKPSKIHVQPLHADDLLYESMKFEPGAGLHNYTMIQSIGKGMSNNQFTLNICD